MLALYFYQLDHVIDEVEINQKIQIVRSSYQLMLIYQFHILNLSDYGLISIEDLLKHQMMMA